MKRFWDKIRKGPGCWEWTASLFYDGYGQFRFRGKNIGAHRMAWTLTRGEIPDGQCVLHRCDNCRCCRPDHLFLGTQADNLADMVSKNRQVNVRGEAHPNAKLTERDVEVIRRLYKPGRVTQRQLAERFGVVPHLISKVVRRKLWRHVT